MSMQMKLLEKEHKYVKNPTDAIYESAATQVCLVNASNVTLQPN